MRRLIPGAASMYALRTTHYKKHPEQQVTHLSQMGDEPSGFPTFPATERQSATFCPTLPHFVPHYRTKLCRCLVGILTCFKIGLGKIGIPCLGRPPRHAIHGEIRVAGGKTAAIRPASVMFTTVISGGLRLNGDLSCAGQKRRIQGRRPTNLM